jgi:hypothetical protein
VEAAILNVIAGTGMNLNQELPLSIFPNPVNDQLTVIGKDVTEEMLITVFNDLGEAVIALRKSGTVDVNCSALPQGIYLLKVIAGDRIFIERFQKN